MAAFEGVRGLPSFPVEIVLGEASGREVGDRARETTAFRAGIAVAGGFTREAPTGREYGALAGTNRARALPPRSEVEPQDEAVGAATLVGRLERSLGDREVLGRCLAGNVERAAAERAAMPPVAQPAADVAPVKELASRTRGPGGRGARALRSGARDPPRNRRPARRGDRPRLPGHPVPRAGPDGGGARRARAGTRDPR